jgi:hypothetical protein
VVDLVENRTGCRGAGNAAPRGFACQRNPGELADAGIDELVVDVPPGMPAAVHARAEHPCRAFVRYQIPPRPRLVDGTMRHLSGLGRVAPVNLGSRQDFPAAATEGTAAVEFAGTMSADEVKQLRAYIDSLLRGRDGKVTG